MGRCVESSITSILSALHRWWIFSKVEKMRILLMSQSSACRKGSSLVVWRNVIPNWISGLVVGTGRSIFCLDLYSEDFTVWNVGNFDATSLLWASHGASLSLVISSSEMEGRGVSSSLALFCIVLSMRLPSTAARSGRWLCNCPILLDVSGINCGFAIALSTFPRYPSFYFVILFICIAIPSKMFASSGCLYENK